jgi:hypothetical protein
VVWVVGQDNGGTHEEPDAVIGHPAGRDLDPVLAAHPVDDRAELGERSVVDNGTEEVVEVGDVTHRQRVDLADEVLTHPGPQRARHVRAGSRRALLALVLKGAPHQGDPQDVDVGGGMGHDEVLPAGLPDQARVRPVGTQVPRDRVPQMAERRR